MTNAEREKRRAKGDWWDRSLTWVSGCNWPEGERPEECRFCYAEPMCKHWPAIHEKPYIDHGFPVPVKMTRVFSNVKTHPDRLDWLKPTGKALTWLCSIAGDLFHPDVPDEFINKALLHIMDTEATRLEDGLPSHRIAILTKRYKRAAEYIRKWWRKSGWAGPNPPAAPFVLMFSAGTQDSVDRACVAAAKLQEGVLWGLHLEPLLERVNIGLSYCCTECGNSTQMTDYWVPLDRSTLSAACGLCAQNGFDRPLPVRVPSWIVCGGETNVRNPRKARPCHPEWVRGIRDQCQASGTPFWFKSWGEWLPFLWYGGRDGFIDAGGTSWGRDRGFYDEFGNAVEHHWGNNWHNWHSRCIGKARAGRLLDGRTWDEMPEGWE